MYKSTKRKDFSLWNDFFKKMGFRFRGTHCTMLHIQQNAESF